MVKISLKSLVEINIYVYFERVITIVGMKKLLFVDVATRTGAVLSEIKLSFYHTSLNSDTN